MSAIEIIGGSCLLLSCIAIVAAVALQSSNSGMSSAIMGGDTSGVKGRGRESEKKLSKITRILAVVLFVVTIIVNIIALANRPAKVDETVSDETSDVSASDVEASDEADIEVEAEVEG